MGLACCFQCACHHLLAGGSRPMHECGFRLHTVLFPG